MNKKNITNFPSIKELISIIPVHIYWLDKYGIYRGCNDIQAKSLGLKDKEDIIGKSNKDLSIFKKYPEISKKLDEINQLVFESGSLLEIEEDCVYPTGEKTVFSTYKVPIHDKNQETIGLIGISFDIAYIKSKFKSLEAKQEETEIALENILANLPGHVYWLDRNNQILGCNDLQVKSFGVKSRDEVIGLNVRSFQTLQNAETLVKNNLRVMNNDEMITEEENYVTSDGKKEVFLSKKAPLKDKTGNIVGLLGISFEITAQKEAEAREKEALEKSLRLEKEKAIAEKQAELFRQLSVTVAHELRTPLGGISIGTSLFEENMPKVLEAVRRSIKNQTPIDSSVVSDRVLNSLEKTVDRIKQELDASFLFINMMLANVRGDQFETGPRTDCKISEVITDTLNRYPFANTQKQKVHIDLSYDFVFNGSHNLLVHVLFNLLKNALYYLAAARKGEITIWGEEKESVNELHFKDTGTGISQEVLPHIFERFFTKTLNGTGIGLTYCKMVMNSFWGDIICKSVEGDYTEFVLCFPKIAL